MIFFDTESIGYYGPTLLIQWAKDNNDVNLHYVFNEPVQETLGLIEQMMEDKEGIVGFNLTHDMYHLSRTYGVLSELPKLHKPDILDYHDVENTDAAKDNYCIKPVTALDLMLHGRKNEFQSTLNQKDIIIRKVPKVLASAIVVELKHNVRIPPIYFSKSRQGYHWRIVELEKHTGAEITQYTEDTVIDEDFVNIRLAFNPSTALKIIMEKVLGHDIFTLDDLAGLPKPVEFGWYPAAGGWMDVAKEYMYEWKNDPRRIEYARNDVIYTRELWEYFGSPPCGDDDSILACAIGAIYWRGYSFDKVKAQQTLDNINKTLEAVKINVNAPAQVKAYIHASCSEMEKLAVPNTAADTLQSLLEWREDNPEVYAKVVEVTQARRLLKEKDLLEKILKAGRLHVTYKVIGTKSNRMSGGSESYLKRGGSINPQGIKKGDIIRNIFTLAPNSMSLSGGDFSGFEVSIAAAVYNDPMMIQDLLSGKKMHGLYGSSVYNMTYEEIMKTESKGENEPDGYYARAKRAFFGKLYGAMDLKISTVLWITEEEAYEANQRFEKRYPGVKEARERIFKNFAALQQEGGIGTPISWHEPQQYVESFLGFRRYFKLEFSIVKALFDMASNPSADIVELGKKIKLRRRDRIQTASGAAASAIYAAAFNIQSQVMRAAANHEIQSPGGQITKTVQKRIWDLQRAGVGKWIVMPMNVHDEVQCPTDPAYTGLVKQVVDETVESFRPKIPLIKMKWKTNLNAWGEK